VAVSTRTFLLSFLFNSLIATFIASRYLITFETTGVYLVEWASILTSLVSHSWLLLGILLLPFVICAGKRFVLCQKLLYVSIATCALSVLWIDTSVFAQYRFHLSGFVFQFLWHGQAITLSWTIWAFAFASIALIGVGQYQLLSWLERFNKPRFDAGYKKIKMTCIGLFAILTVSSHMLNAYASAFHLSNARAFQAYLPLFYPLRANSLFIRLGLVSKEDIAKRSMKQSFQGSFKYPLQALEYSHIRQPKDIMLIVVDALRKDTLNSKFMPRTFAFAQKHQAVSLPHHFSSSNATRLGIFGLFYGLYPTYWSNVLIQQQSPVWLDRMQDLDYQMGIFASAQLRYPEFSQTIFSGIKNLRVETEGADAVIRDQKATQEWLAWFSQRDQKKPHFSFFFYDAVHAYGFPDDYPVKFEPMAGENFVMMRTATADPEPIFNRYRTAAHYVDSLIGDVLERLEQEGTLDHTLVIITSDHGEEMNDVKRNYWGHGSSFSDAQVRVPFLMMGAGIEQHAEQLTQHQMTSHYDIAPTIMQHYLGLISDVSLMSDGSNMLDADVAEHEWLILGRYDGYGVRTAEHIINISKTGYYEVFDTHYRDKDSANMNQQVVQEVMLNLNRFRKH
tara:strand:+ start:30612 stop:32465 length:1854 start_codon:yes stop_codon:yes gene_type:complete